MHFDLILKRLDAELGERGNPYEVWLGNELIVKSHDPEFAACRKLLKSGRLGAHAFAAKAKQVTTSRWILPWPPSGARKRRREDRALRSV